MNVLALARNTIGSAAGTAADLVFPPFCFGCRSDTLAPGKSLCGACQSRAEPLRPPSCDVCSEPFSGDVGPGPFACANCRGRHFAFGCAVARLRARGLVRDLIARFKYQGHHYLRRPLGDWLVEACDDERLRRGHRVEVLVPVPLHPRRLRERGFNQALVLAQIAGRRTGLPVLSNALRRVRWTDTQTRFNRHERMRNLLGAFAVHECRRPAIEGRHLLVVDDVFTTGSTIDECARVLLTAGAASVRAITVARR